MGNLRTAGLGIQRERSAVGRDRASFCRNGIYLRMGALHWPQGPQRRDAPFWRFGAAERSAEVLWVHRRYRRCRSSFGDCGQVTFERGSTKFIFTQDRGDHYAANWSSGNLESDQESAKRIAQLRSVDVASL